MSSKEKLENQKNLNKEKNIEISLEDQLIQILVKRKGINADILSDQQDINDVIKDQVKELQFQASSQKTIRDLSNQITKIAQDTYSINKDQLGLTETNVKITQTQAQLDKTIILLNQQRNKLLKEGGQTNVDIADSIGMQVKEAIKLKNSLDDVAKNSQEISSNFSVKAFGGLADIFKAVPGLSKFSQPFEAAAEGARGMAANIQDAATSGGRGLTKERIKQLGLEKKLGNLSGAAAANKLKGMSGFSKGLMSAKAGFKALGPLITKALGPVGIIIELVQAFIKVDKLSKDVALSQGISVKEGQKQVANANAAARASGDLLVRTEQVVAAQASLNKLLGTAAEFSGEFAAEFASVSARTGLSEKAMAKFASKALMADTTIKDQLKKVAAVTLELNAQNDTAFSLKEIQEGVAQISNANALSAKMNTKELAKQVFQAKLLGLEQGKVNDIADSLLDFESSIQAEMEAEVLTGKQLNLEKARSAALNNDMATVAAELAKQGISAAEFGAMNRMEQQAIAKAMGMSRDEMGDMLMNQENIAALQAKYGDDVKTTSDVQAKYNKMLKEGTLTEEMKAQLAEDGILAQMESANTMDQLNGMMAKFQDLFVQIMTPLMPIIDALMKVLTPIFNVLGKIINLVLDVLNPLLVSIGDTFGGIGMIFDGIANFDMSMILEGLKVVGKGIIDFLLMPFDALVRLLNKIPGVNIPIPSDVITNLVGLAEGGIVTKPTTALIGEGGEPEAVIPLSKLDEVTGGGSTTNTALLKQLNTNVVRLIAAVEAGGDVFIDGNKVGKSLALVTSNMG